MILALATTSATTRAWLLADDAVAANTDARHAQTAPQPLAHLEWESGRTLADELLSRLQAFLAGHHATFTDLTGIVILSGPGSFTSLRIGHTVANALADSLGIPVAGAPSAAVADVDTAWIVPALAALAATAPGTPALPHYGAEANITKPKTHTKS